MSLPAPILDAIELMRRAVAPALAAGGGRVRWLVDDDPTGDLPVLVFQSQDAGGGQTETVGAIGWSGLVLIKGLGRNQNEAAAALAAALDGLATIAAPAGYAIRATPRRPGPPLPPVDGVWTASYLYKIEIERG
ncbi:MAG TPA: hypothetical protein VFS21_29860 [Roseiflexaceae bacterium]|nr:hypothetical protein [Roseiflexaceae bacterium]